LHLGEESLWTLWRRKKSLALLRIKPLFPVNFKSFDDGVKHWRLLGFCESCSILNSTTFRKLDLFLPSGDGGDTYVVKSKKLTPITGE
jgi:hypothetical protein